MPGLPQAAQKVASLSGLGSSHNVKHHSVWLKLESLSFPAVYVRPHPVQGVPPAMRGFLPHLQEAAQRQDQVHRRRQGEQFTEQDLNKSKITQCISYT